MKAKRRGRGPSHFTRPATFKPTNRLGRKVDSHTQTPGAGLNHEYRRLAYALIENPNEWILVRTYTRAHATELGEGLEWLIRTARHVVRRLTFTGVNKEGVVSISEPIQGLYGRMIFDTHMVESEMDVLDSGDVQVFARWTEKLEGVA